MEGLPARFGGLAGVEAARRGHDRSADREAALFLNDQRLGLLRHDIGRCQETG
jgi:hypothetical protein